MPEVAVINAVGGVQTSAPHRTRQHGQLMGSRATQRRWRQEGDEKAWAFVRGRITRIQTAAYAS